MISDANISLCFICFILPLLHRSRRHSLVLSLLSTSPVSSDSRDSFNYFPSSLFHRAVFVHLPWPLLLPCYLQWFSYVHIPMLKEILRAMNDASTMSVYQYRWSLLWYFRVAISSPPAPRWKMISKVLSRIEFRQSFMIVIYIHCFPWLARKLFLSSVWHHTMRM